MRILQITAGAARMYCGSCLRDNALAAELLARGHDVALLPFYTPTLTDERNVSRERVFFGGISLYLQQHSALFRHTPRLLDRLWDSRLALKLASMRAIPTSPVLLGEMTVSMLKGEEGNQAKELKKLIDWLAGQPPFDIVSLPYTLLLGLARPLGEALGRPVACTLQGEDLFLKNLPEPYRSESLELIRAQVRHVDVFIAVSDFYGEHMPGYLSIPREKLRVVPLGINLEGYEMRRAPEAGRPATIGYFARVAPEKGLHLLAESYIRLRETGSLVESRLEVAGYLGPEHAAYLKRVEDRLAERGLAGEFNYRGVLDRRGKIDFLRGLAVLSVPASYDEPKGIFLLEALACGVPVVQPRRGAFTEIVERTRGGLLVAPDDVESLAEGIASVLNDPATAERLSEEGYAGVRRHYNVGLMAGRTLDVFEEVLSDRAGSETLKAVERRSLPGAKVRRAV